MGCGISSASKRKSIIENFPSVKIKNTAESFVTSNTKTFTDVYTVEESLGSGAYGEVKKVIHKVTGQERAVKIFRKENYSDLSYAKIKKEIDILRELNHPVIIKMYEYFEDNSNVYIVLEKCDGGELFDQISKKKCLSENLSAIICKQLFSAVAYLHDKKIVHRDIKPENILLEDKDDLINIKIVDFGASTQFNKKKMTEIIGSIYYLSPEVIERSYDEKCDMWSLGVILYILLSGCPPFLGNSNEQIMLKIKARKYSFENPVWRQISDEAKDLIQKLLCPSNIRLTAKQAFLHPWVQTKGLYPDLDCDCITNAIENLKEFQSRNKLRDAIGTFITSQVMSAHETKGLREIFKSIDLNGDGKLSKEEIIKGFKIYDRIDNRKEYIEIIMSQADTDGNGYIDYNEFIKATISHHKIYSLSNIKKAFDLFDLDGSGKISSGEFDKIFSIGNIKKSLWQEVILEIDKNLDGEIDFDEFYEFIQRISSNTSE
jgi:calcium-dependent protein kinase